MMNDLKGRNFCFRIGTHQCFVGVNLSVFRADNGLEIIGKEILIKQFFNNLAFRFFLFGNMLFRNPLSAVFLGKAEFSFISSVYQTA